MDGFKTFYNDKNGKYILFFGFYLIFFIVVSIYMRSLDAKKPIETIDDKPVIKTYNLSKLIENDYHYKIEIVDNTETINFSGTKNNIDYANFENKYFLDIYNINQLLKKGKMIKLENNILMYEINNKEIADILLTDQKDGSSSMLVTVNDDETVNMIHYDLSSYFGKSNYTITIEYELGEEDENSSS